jgi:hypothetical protein
VVDLRHHFVGLTRDAARSPFTATLAATIADLPNIVALLAEAPPEQQSPVLLLAAIHEQVLAAPNSELAAWYPSVTPTPRTDDITDALVEHCRAHESALRSVIATRHTQTNEVGRCGFFLPAFAAGAGDVGPLALVDVGTSAGLNLFPDLYHYDYDPGGAVGPASDVRLHITTTGRVPVPDEVPEIAARIGIDAVSVDPDDDGQTRWLRACIWPDQADRFERFDAALAIAREHAADRRHGDAVELLRDAVTDAAAHGHPVVMNSWVLNYLSKDQRRRYVAVLDELGTEHDLTWVYAESPGQAGDLPFPGRLAGQHITALQLVRWRAGERRVEHLATTHPHGYWLHWAT